MNKQQQQNLSKYLYDLSKIILATLVIGQVIRPEEFRIWIVLSGVAASIGTFLWAYILDGSKEIE